MVVLPAREATFFGLLARVWVVLPSWAQQGVAPGPASLPNLAHQAVRLDVSWEPGRPVLFPSGGFT